MSSQKKQEMVDVATLVIKTINIRERIADLLKKNAPNVRKRLYVQICPPQKPNELLSILPIVYENAAKHCSHLDVRLLLGIEKPHVKFYDSDRHNIDLSNTDDTKTESLPWKKKYDYTVLGGTFDRLHYGHYLLLSTSILLSNKYIVCGVTDNEMNKNKELWELIQPAEKRIADIHEFVNDVSSGVELRAETITDPFGPSIIDEKLQCIVVSKETYRGGEAVNKKRSEKGLSTLDIVEIGLLCGSNEALGDSKLSSSSIRRSLPSK